MHFTGSDNDETVELKEEVAIDIATGAILGVALREVEDSEGVARVVVEARKECENLLAILADNGSPWYLTGSPHANWNDDDLHALGAVFGDDFEVVDTSSLVDG